jgi:hypothetical protein
MGQLVALVFPLVAVAILTGAEELTQFELPTY